MGRIKEKMNLNFTADIKEYLVEQSKLTGISTSAYLTMLILMDRQQKEDTTVSLVNTNDLLKRIEELEEKVVISSK
jgi:hypothetical protein